MSSVSAASRSKQYRRRSHIRHPPSATPTVATAISSVRMRSLGRLSRMGVDHNR